MRRPHGPEGQILVIALVLLAGAMVAGLALLAAGSTTRLVIQRNRATRAARALADAGIARAVHCLNRTDAGACGGSVGDAYAGESALALGGGTVTTSVTSVSGTVRRITASGIAAAGSARATVAVAQDVAFNASAIGFRYGAQVGNRGVTLGNNARIEGSVLASGNVAGGNGSRITGDAIVATGPPLADTVRVDAAPSTITAGHTAPFVDVAQRFTVAESAPLRSVSVYLRRVGTPTDAIVRVVQHDAEADAPARSEVARATLRWSQVGTSLAWVTLAYPTAPALAAGRTYWIVLDANARRTDYWMLGADPATPGTIVASDWTDDEWQDAGGTIAHRVTTGGLQTTLSGLTVGNDAYAPRISWASVSGSSWSSAMEDSVVGGSATSGTITHSTIGGNATAETITTSTIGGSVWCETITSSTVGGQRNCPTEVTPPTDPSPAPFPITPAQVDQWIADARASGTIAGDYEPSEETTVTLGPTAITGDLTIENRQTLVVTGTIHVAGNLSVGNQGSIVLDPAYGTNSGMVVVDGTIHLENNGAMRGSGTTGSFLLLVARTTGGGHHDSAIDIHNGANGAIFFAPNGTINLHNTATVSQLTADGITLNERAVLTYDRGFLDARFTAGPAVQWTPVPGTWAVQ